jgi:hypothetical protein
MTVNNLAVVIGPNALRKRVLQADQLGDSNKVISLFGLLIQCHETVKKILKVFICQTKLFLCPPL